MKSDDTTPKRLGLVVSLIAATVFTVSCGGESIKTSDEHGATNAGTIASDASSDLPLSTVNFDQIGPANLEAMVAESEVVVEAELVEVLPGARYFGPDEEAPDAIAYEQVELILEPVDIHKGALDERKIVSVLWTGYMVEDTKPGSERHAKVEVNGLVVNEGSIGQRFGVFIEDQRADPLFPFTTEGLVPLSADGKIATRHDDFSGVLVRSHIGDDFGDIVSAHRS